MLDCTPFYAEMGGQVADHGVIETDGALFQVTDVQKDKAGKFLHHGVMHSGHLQVEQTVTARIDTDRRKAIMRAHSATHLLQAALREVLGDHVHQAGSLVEPDHLRFDLTHFSAITPEEHKYLYFVAITDGGRHAFSTNLDDHNRAVRQYLKNRRAQRQQ